MRIDKLTFSQTGQFSSIFLDYIAKKPALAEFHGPFPDISNFKDQIESRGYADNQRAALVESIEAQYSGFDTSENLRKNLELLKDSNTFTITTGHQLNIFSGPLYFIYKIVSTINTCKILKENNPDQNFVPVYWMASEDHDFAEINHFNLFGKRHIWESDQKGPVGKFGLEGIEEILNNLPEKVELFEKAYKNQEDLSNATRSFVNDLFGNEGLVILDADSASLKSMFTAVIKDDLINHTANDAVVRDSEKINQLGYKAQVFPRLINFFYMEKGLRERIIVEDEIYKVNNTDLSFTQEEILSLLESNPEKFSPNVILRPLYQEVILPNLAYIGGPGELAYWLQLKEVFDHYQVQFPILLPRNHALFINKGNVNKMNKLNLNLEDIFKDFNELKDSFLKNTSGTDYELGAQKEQLEGLFSQIIQKAESIDPSLKGFVAGEGQKTLKGLENIEKRLKRSEEAKSETSITQIKTLLEKLFPGNGPQERQDNFLNFYINNPSFIQILLDNFDPFDLRYMVIIDE